MKLKQLLHTTGIPLAAILLVCLYPCVFLYGQNAAEVGFVSIFPFLGVFCVNALFFLLLFLAVIRRFDAAAAITCGAMLLVINFGLIYTGITDHFPDFPAWVLMVILGVVVIAVTISLAIKRPNLRWCCVLLAITFAVLSAASLVVAVVSGGTASPNEAAQEKLAEKYEPQTFTGDKPNVYFFLFDEYGGYENLIHYYDYDNAAFYDAMSARGFQYCKDSHNTESILTVTLVPNLMNLNYVCSDKTGTKKKNAMLTMPNLFRTFKENGYSINLVNHLNYFGTEGCNVLTDNQVMRTISDYLLKNSLYHYITPVKDFLNTYIKADYVASYTKPLLKAMEVGKSCWKEVGDGPTFTMLYYQTPHAPTILDKDGKLVEDWQNCGWYWGESKYYLGQLEFVNSFILEAVDQIIAHDPDALVIVQSDHGCRQAKHYYELGRWTTYDAPSENLYMQNSLSLVRCAGHSFAIDGETGMNSLRLILNEVFGTNYETIKPKYYTEGEFEKERN